MKKHLVTIVLAIMFLIGLSVMLYPIVSDYLNSLSQTRVIARFNEDLARLSEKDYTELFEAAREYNKRLLTKSNRFNMSEEEREEYLSMLNVSGRGMIGTLEIGAINVKLPIYLGTSEGVLQIGIGHLEGTSLPIGGPGTHSVISGHRGLPSSTLLTNVDKLVVGDTFAMKILNETLTYEIDQIVVVEPDDFSNLEIDPNEDYCTLLTCTPYGINSHRLLARGHRIFPVSDGEIVQNETEQQINKVIVCIIAAVLILVIFFIYSFIKRRKIRGRG